MVADGQMNADDVVISLIARVPNRVRRHNEKCFLRGKRLKAQHRPLRQNLTAMAQSWDSGPVGGELRPSSFQGVHYLPQPEDSFLFRDHVLSPKNLHPAALRSSVDWSAPIWLSNLCHILELRFRYPNHWPEPDLQGLKTRLLVQADPITYQQTNPSIQTQREAAVAYPSTPTDLK